MNWNISKLDAAQQKIMQELAEPLKVKLAYEEECLDTSILIDVRISGKGILVEKTSSGISIQVETLAQLARAASLLAEGRFGTQAPAYQRLEFMWDCSRNAVANFESFKKMVRCLALMGYTGVQMYTEDTYEIEKYPYFGYMRGRYTTEELKQMENYASIFLIELIPCIQTLAHLGQMLRWQASKEFLDCNDILLADSNATYDLIEEMVKTMASALSCRRINIGMDEAQMLGLGKFLDQHGYQNRMEIMLRHFGKVIKILRRYGYSPMMWSDMFFRLLSGGEYYNEKAELTTEMRKCIPDDLTLIYWDYYSREKGKYDSMLKSHKLMSSKVAFAGGAWSWVGFSPNNRYSLYVSELADASCKENGVTDVIITSWGDDGADTPTFDILPTLQFWAECCYSPDHCEKLLAERFKICTGGNWDDFLLLDAANLTPDNAAPGLCGASQTRYLVYQDLLIGLCDLHVPESYPQYYQNAAEQLWQAAGRNSSWSLYFETQAALCSLIAAKSRAGVELRTAYKSNDRQKLEEYYKEKLDIIQERLAAFIALYRRQWLQSNKVFGLEIFDQRIGGLAARISFTKERIHQYLSGEITNLEELEQQLLPFDGEMNSPSVLKYTFWKNIVSGCVVTY